MKSVFSIVSALVAAVSGTSLSVDDCYLPIDVLFLQDTTGSFEDDLPNVVKQIPEMVSQINSLHPSSRFAVAEFKDKPYSPLGLDGSQGPQKDFCYNLSGELTSDVDEFLRAYSKLYASGGMDLPEAQFQALITAALDPAVGWRPVGKAVRGDDSVTGARLIVISTDAKIHLPGDMEKLGVSVAPLPPNTGSMTPGNPNFECENHDYPTDQQVLKVLKDQQIYLAILTPNDPVCDENGQHCENIFPVWQWVNEELLGQPSDFYQFIRSDSSDLLAGVLRAVDSVTRVACATTTTTPSPTSATTATQTTATTATQTTATTATQTTATQTTATTATQTTATTATQTTATTDTAPTKSESSEPHCRPDCPHCPCPKLFVNVKNQPKKFVLDYES